MRWNTHSCLFLNKLNTNFLAICHFGFNFFFKFWDLPFFFFACSYITFAFPAVISSDAFKHTLPLPSRDWVRLPSLPRVNVYTKYSKPIDLWFEHSDQGWLWPFPEPSTALAISLTLTSCFWARCLSMTKPFDKCHSPSESLLHKRFFWVSKLGIFLQCWPLSFYKWSS